MAYAEIQCPHCGAAGRVENHANSPLLMGRCPVCSGYVIYFCGASLPVEEAVFASHSIEAVREHIMHRLDDFLQTQLTEFLETFAEELELTDAEVPESVIGEAAIEHTDAGGPLPSVANPDLGHITEEEVRDFLGIDLQLIDRSPYFWKYFGR